MEDVLEVYSRPYSKEYPVICMDEKPVQLLSNVREELPVRPGDTAKQDNEYERNGTCSIFLFTEPLDSWRFAKARERRTKKDWAEEIEWLVEKKYPCAKKIVLVMDNLNTHTISSLYERFSPEKAFRLAQKLEIHYTPKHGSWLNIAEIELSALGSQCLGDRRIDNIEFLNNELSAWMVARNKKQKGVDWQFTSEDARIKLKRLYPVIEEDESDADENAKQLSLFL